MYPFFLSYTLPNSTKYSVKIVNEGQSEDESHKMFETGG